MVATYTKKVMSVVGGILLDYVSHGGGFPFFRNKRPCNFDKVILPAGSLSQAIINRAIL